MGLSRARSGCRSVRWRPHLVWSRRCTAPTSRSRTPPRSAWSTISVLPAIRLPVWCRFRASREMPWAPSKRSMRRGLRPAGDGTAQGVSLSQVICDHAADGRRHVDDLQRDFPGRSRRQCSGVLAPARERRHAGCALPQRHAKRLLPPPPQGRVLFHGNRRSAVRGLPAAHWRRSPATMSGHSGTSKSIVQAAEGLQTPRKAAPAAQDNCAKLRYAWVHAADDHEVPDAAAGRPGSCTAATASALAKIQGFLRPQLALREVQFAHENLGGLQRAGSRTCQQQLRNERLRVEREHAGCLRFCLAAAAERALKVPFNCGAFELRVSMAYQKSSGASYPGRSRRMRVRPPRGTLNVRSGS